MIFNQCVSLVVRPLSLPNCLKLWKKLVFNQFLSLVVRPIAEQTVSGKHEDEKNRIKRKNNETSGRTWNKRLRLKTIWKQKWKKDWTKKDAYEKNRRIFQKKIRKKIRKTGRTSKCSHVNEICYVYLADIFFPTIFFLLTSYLSNPYNLPSIGFNSRKGDEGDNNPRK